VQVQIAKEYFVGSDLNIYGFMQRTNIMEAQPSSGHIRSNTGSSLKWLRILTAVAAFVLLVWLVWKVYHIYQLSTDKIYSQSYIPFEFTVEAENEATPIELSYAAKDYKDVIRKSKKVFSVTEQERLLIGLSYLESGEYLRAISWLNRLTIVDNPPLKQTAEYYLTLAYLKNEDFDSAIVQMQRIINNPAHLYHRQFTPEMIKELRLIKWK
jgi:hypothetical protein